MKKILFGIFAHPDDEAFGPAGTLLQETRDGTELHLICLTAGDAGTNSDNLPNLAEVRLKEWEKSAALLGAKSNNFFGYKDGQLSNSSMIEAGQRIVALVDEIVDGEPDDTSIEFMTFDLGGLSGHIDHIVAARAACWAFYTVKQGDERFTRMRLYCLPADIAPEHSIDWLYKDKGRPTEEIDETIDARPLREEIIEVMRAHHTQRSDCETILKAQGDRLGLNCFVVKS
jgi:LmbE family N-acetylglucosaminyl deacetylase